jgi:hypothetical protein
MNTFVADVKLHSGRFYFEVQVLSLEPDCVVQFGVCTNGFEARVDPGGEGVGDDSFSFAVDGVRQRKWPGGCASMSVSVDGSFGAPNGLAFHNLAPKYHWLSPAFSGSGGRFGINFGDKPFMHKPPDVNHSLPWFVSVHRRNTYPCDFCQYKDCFGRCQ